ncbi:MAG: hypothetical protein NXH85_11130 [Pseudomonadaceae bacterium]|nr:hypothetical protein [Pseudomonadaceae bacterium]
MKNLEGDIKAWDAIANHRTGTDGDDETGTWLQAEATALGFVAKQTHFELNRIEPQLAQLTIGETTITGSPLFDCTYTGAEGVSGVLGRDIAVLPFQPFDGHPQTRSLQAARRSERYKAIIALASADIVAPGLAVMNAEDFRAPVGPPVLQVASEHSELLRAATERSARATLIAQITQVPDRASNVQVHVPGSNPNLAPLVIMTPRSAWFTCTAERAGGIAVWLAALRAFARKPPKRPVILWANSGHELSHLGLDDALHASPTLARNAHAWVHLGANFAAAVGEVRLQASSAELMDQLVEKFARHGAQVDQQGEPLSRPLGEARNIFDSGGRFISILGSNRLFHHPQDRWPDSVDLPKTRAIAIALLAAIDELANA